MKSEAEILETVLELKNGNAVPRMGDAGLSDMNIAAENAARRAVEMIDDFADVKPMAEKFGKSDDEFVSMVGGKMRLIAEQNDIRAFVAKQNIGNVAAMMNAQANDALERTAKPAAGNPLFKTNQERNVAQNMPLAMN